MLKIELKSGENKEIKLTTYLWKTQYFDFLPIFDFKRKRFGQFEVCNLNVILNKF